MSIEATPSNTIFDTDVKKNNTTKKTCQNFTNAINIIKKFSVLFLKEKLLFFKKIILDLLL